MDREMYFSVFTRGGIQMLRTDSYGGGLLNLYIETALKCRCTFKKKSDEESLSETAEEFLKILNFSGGAFIYLFFFLS